MVPVRVMYVARRAQVRRARIENCLHRGDKISIPKFAVCSNANDLSKDVFRAVSSKEEILAQFNRCNNSYEIVEGGKLKTRHIGKDVAALSLSLSFCY